MTQFRIQQRNRIVLDPGDPFVDTWYVIQRKFLWFWTDMHFHDYGDTIMWFEFKWKAEDYLKQLREIYK